MRILLLLSIIGMLTSCGAPEEAAPMSIDEIGFTALSSIKNNDRQKFMALFDDAVLAQTPQGQLDSTFEFYKNILADYDFPDFATWKKDRFFWKNDTLSRVMAIGLPLVNTSNTKVDYFFEMQYTAENKLAGIRLNKTPDADVLPDDQFPPKEEAFNYSVDSLVSIRLYSLPGVNSDPHLSKSLAFTNTQFDDAIRSDFGKVIATLNQSQITGAEKTVSEQSNTNDLKAVILVFKDKGKQRNVFLLSNNIAEKPLDVNIFYVTNATYAYQLNESSTVQLKSDIDAVFEKYFSFLR